MPLPYESPSLDSEAKDNALKASLIFRKIASYCRSFPKYFVMDMYSFYLQRYYSHSFVVMNSLISILLTYAILVTKSQILTLTKSEMS